MKRTIFTLISLCFLCLGTCLNAQSEYLKHEFSVGGFGGIMSLNHDLSKGESSNKLSGGIGFGYTYFFSPCVGLGTGLDFAFYNGEIQIDDLSGSQQAFDLDLQKDFEFGYTLRNYKESQNAFYLNIPVMLNYQFGQSQHMKFYGAGGFKIGLPINGKYKTAGGELETTGYYPHNGDIIDDMPFRGFGQFDVRPYEDKIKYKMSFSLALEGGAKWKLPNEMWLYTGLFIDYGLNDIKKEDESGNESLVQYNPLNPENHIYNGTLSSSYMSDGNENKLISKVNTMGYGVRLRLAFGK